jgi:hypothetical protein
MLRSQRVQFPDPRPQEVRKGASPSAGKSRILSAGSIAEYCVATRYIALPPPKRIQLLPIALVMKSTTAGFHFW